MGRATKGTGDRNSSGVGRGTIRDPVQKSNEQHAYHLTHADETCALKDSLL